MSEYSFSSDSDSFIMTPEGSEYTPEASMLGSSIVDVAAPSSPSSFASYESSESYSGDEGDAEAEWQESIQQLELLLSMVLVPFIGKWVGRKCAYIAWSKFMTWKYPVNVVTDRTTFNIAGVVSAVSSSL